MIKKTTISLVSKTYTSATAKRTYTTHVTWDIPYKYLLLVDYSLSCTLTNSGDTDVTWQINPSLSCVSDNIILQFSQGSGDGSINKSGSAILGLANDNGFSLGSYTTSVNGSCTASNLNLSMTIYYF